MKDINLGIIGLGEIGKRHLHNALRLKGVNLVAVADISRRSQRYAVKTCVKKAYSDYKELLQNPKVDCVIISLPTFLHAKCAIEAAHYEKHILIEKPLARNTVEAEQILSATKRNRVKLMVGYPLRFYPSFIKLKNELKRGTLGDVQIATANHISTGPFFQRAEKSIPKPVPSWWFDKKLTGGGAFLDLGCHMINLLRWYFGEVTSIQCRLGYRFNLDFEDHATCTLKFKNGTIATLNVGWFARYLKVQVDLYGTVKHASATSQSPSLLYYAKKIFTGDISSGFYKELEYFVNCVSSDINPSPSGEEGLEDLRLISMAYQHTL